MSKLNWVRAHDETRGRQQDRETREAARARKRQRYPHGTKDVAAVSALQFKHDPPDWSIRSFLGLPSVLPVQGHL